MLMKWRKIQMLEEMQSFFTNRVDGYDEHMISCVEGCKEAYQKIAQFVPDDAKQLLDLGCGTGLELEEIFRMYPEMEVTGIDLTEAMLAQLKKKYAHRKLNLINGDYFKEEFGVNHYDTPCTIDNQKIMLLNAGFKDVELIWREGNTTLMVAHK